MGKKIKKRVFEWVILVFDFKIGIFYKKNFICYIII